MNDAGMIAVSDENEHVTRRYTEELINQRNLSVADEIFSSDFVSHAAEDGQPADVEALKQFFVMLCAGLPDFRCTVEDLFTVGDRVAFRFTFVGTHEGEFMGIAPTGKRVTMSGIDILRVADGKIAELWGQEDWLGLLQQLGALPKQGEVTAQLESSPRDR